MRIAIAERLKPFSHEAGTRCIIPGSYFAAEIFPNRLVLFDYRSTPANPVDHFFLSLAGPVKDFTVQQDLEKNFVRVSGVAESGYFLYILFSENDEIKIHIKKGDLQLKGNKITENLPSRNYTGERLSFGCHKAQNVVRAKERTSMEELLPFWLRLGSAVPLKGRTPHFTNAWRLFDEGKKNKLLQELQKIYIGYFRSLWLPIVEDDQYHGLNIPEVKEGEPLILLSEGAELIKKMLFQVKDGVLYPLPLLPSTLSSGRMTEISVEDYGKFSMEWRKRVLRRAVYKATEDKQIQLKIPGKSSFRVRKKPHERGDIYRIDEPFMTYSGTTYLLDRFS